LPQGIRSRARAISPRPATVEPCPPRWRFSASTGSAPAPVQVLVSARRQLIDEEGLEEAGGLDNFYADGHGQPTPARASRSACSYDDPSRDQLTKVIARQDRRRRPDRERRQVLHHRQQVGRPFGTESDARTTIRRASCRAR
jgi:hypothetical protein